MIKSVHVSNYIKDIQNSYITILFCSLIWIIRNWKVPQTLMTFYWIRVEKKSDLFNITYVVLYINNLILDCLDLEYIFQSFIYEVSVRFRWYLRVVFLNIFFSDCLEDSHCRCDAGQIGECRTSYHFLLRPTHHCICHGNC